MFGLLRKEKKEPFGNRYVLFIAFLLFRNSSLNASLEEHKENYDTISESSESNTMKYVGVTALSVLSLAGIAFYLLIVVDISNKKNCSMRLRRIKEALDFCRFPSMYSFDKRISWDPSKIEKVLSKRDSNVLKHRKATLNDIHDDKDLVNSIFEGDKKTLKNYSDLIKKSELANSSEMIVELGKKINTLLHSVDEDTKNLEKIIINYLATNNITLKERYSFSLFSENDLSDTLKKGEFIIRIITFLFENKSLGVNKGSIEIDLLSILLNIYEKKTGYSANSLFYENSYYLNSGNGTRKGLFNTLEKFPEPQYLTPAKNGIMQMKNGTLAAFFIRRDDDAQNDAQIKIIKNTLLKYKVLTE